MSPGTNCALDPHVIEMNQHSCEHVGGREHTNHHLKGQGVQWQTDTERRKPIRKRNTRFCIDSDHVTMWSRTRSVEIQGFIMAWRDEVRFRLGEVSGQHGTARYLSSVSRTVRTAASRQYSPTTPLSSPVVAAQL
ncbi:hypothetical protein J6590_010036 [Homalodisca vitripennis]|nr:hypothetical protein J6590_010036 [Homalodisca vitripennis]